MKAIHAIGSHSDSSASGKSRTTTARKWGHFRFNTISALALLVFIGVGLGLQQLTSVPLDAESSAFVAAGALGAAAILFVLPY